MTPKTITTLAAAALLATGAAAFADDTTMDGEQLDALLTGNTVYIDVPAGGPMGDGGEMPLYHGTDGAVHARLPTGNPMVGVYPRPSRSCRSRDVCSSYTPARSKRPPVAGPGRSIPP